MTGWGLCTTVKAPADQVLAFVAHHLALGAARIWLHFDEPDDPAMAAVADLPGVESVACDDAYWHALMGRRPGKHQNRQSRNMQRVYALGALPWVAHIDVDEFLWPARPVADVLAGVPEDAPLIRMAPHEALHDPALPDDIFTARHFRAALKGDGRAADRALVFADYAGLLPEGVLSHSAGKCFFRGGLRGMEPRLHGAFRWGERVRVDGFTPDIALLHFHAQDPVAWKDRLAFRIARGAYQYNPPLAEWLGNAAQHEVDAFYAAVQNAAPGTVAMLRSMGALITADLGLRARVAGLTPPSARPVSDPR
ncbi:MAG TPA: glycosyltransferase family 2 protein [Paracoccaceae bacterium]|nr:glycosyltransferase family 2 protein [Paracoccaceae bacterium]